MEDKEMFQLELAINTLRLQLKQSELELAYKKSQKELFDKVQKIVDAGCKQTEQRILDMLRRQYGG